MKSQSHKGVYYMLIGAAFFAAMGACLKYAMETIPVFQAVFFRSIVSTLILGAVVIRKGLPRFGKNRKFLLIRSIVGFVAMVCSFYALSKIPLADAAVLHHTSPLFVALFSTMFLGEKVTGRLVFMLGVALVGIVFVYQPGGQSLSHPGLIALLAGALAGLAYVTVRHLHQTESSWIIAFHMATITALLSLPVMIFDFAAPGPGEWTALLAAGLFGTGGQIFMTKAYRYEQASHVAPFSYASVILSVVFGALFWGEIPNAYALGGMAMIIASGVAIARLRFPERKTIPSEVTGP